MGSSSFQPAATEKGGGPGACPFPSPSAASAPGNRGLPLPLSSRRAPGLPTRACERRQSPPARQAAPRPAEPRPRSPRARPDPPAEAGEGYQQLGQDGGQLPAAQRLRPAPHLPEGHGARRRRALLRHAAAAPEPRQLPAGPEARRRDRKLAAGPAGLASSPLAAPTNHREEAACLAREGLDSVVGGARSSRGGSTCCRVLGAEGRDPEGRERPQAWLALHGTWRLRERPALEGQAESGSSWARGEGGRAGSVDRPHAPCRLQAGHAPGPRRRCRPKLRLRGPRVPGAQVSADAHPRLPGRRM